MNFLKEVKKGDKIAGCLVLLAVLPIWSVLATGAQEKVNLRILGVEDWYPSELALKLVPLFNEYAEQGWGYSVDVEADFASFTVLYEKVATVFVAHSGAYDVVGNQRLGAFSTGVHVVQLNEVIESDPKT